MNTHQEQLTCNQTVELSITTLLHCLRKSKKHFYDVLTLGNHGEGEVHFLLNRVVAREGDQTPPCQPEGVEDLSPRVHPGGGVHQLVHLRAVPQSGHMTPVATLIPQSHAPIVAKSFPPSLPRPQKINTLLKHPKHHSLLVQI